MKDTITVSAYCPIGSYGRWLDAIHQTVSGRFDVDISSRVDENIPFDQINRTIFSFEIPKHFAVEFEDILCKIKANKGYIPNEGEL